MTTNDNKRVMKQHTQLDGTTNNEQPSKQCQWRCDQTSQWFSLNLGIDDSSQLVVTVTV